MGYVLCWLFFFTFLTRDIEADLAQLQSWLKTMGRKPKIAIEIKKRVRNHPSYLPEAYSTSFALTVEMLTNDIGNTQCIHHQRKDKNTTHVDGGNTVKGIKIHGVPYPKAGNGKKEKKAQVNGYFSCGCAPETAVAGALFWKTWRISSIIDGSLVSEGFGPQPLNPRNVLFIIQNLKKLGINWRDLFRGDIGGDNDIHEQEVAERIVARICKKYKETWGVDLPMNS